MVLFHKERRIVVLRISKLTDYGTVILAHLATHERSLSSAAEVAGATGLGLPTVRKLLKLLGKSELVVATRGAQGGYRLARDAARISAADVIDALEGPVSITECSAIDRHCELEPHCSVGSAWQRINIAIRHALGDISLVDLRNSGASGPIFEFAGMPVHVERKVR